MCSRVTSVNDVWSLSATCMHSADASWLSACKVVPRDLSQLTGTPWPHAIARFSPCHAEPCSVTCTVCNSSSLQLDHFLLKQPKNIQRMQDYVVKELQQVPGMALVKPQGAFYCLPVVTSFFGPSASAEGFGSIPDADTLCRSAITPPLSAEHCWLAVAAFSLLAIICSILAAGAEHSVHCYGMPQCGPSM